MSRRKLGFEFGMTGPCSECPFRNDIRPYLRRERAQGIVDDLERKTFACHKSIYRVPRDAKGRFAKKVLQHCGVALVTMHKSGRQGDMQQIAERLGLYSREDLMMDSPVYDSFESFVEANR